MNLLSQITIQRPGDDPQIQLLLGDLTTIKKQHAADILVISAYPGSYIPVPNTLMAALYNKGVNVGELAKDKEINLLDQLGCWLSKPLTPLQQEQLIILYLFFSMWFIFRCIHRSISNSRLWFLR